MLSLQALIVITMTYLNKLVAGNKISKDDASRVLGDMKKKCSDILEKNASSEAAGIEVSYPCFYLSSFIKSLLKPSLICWLRLTLIYSLEIHKDTKSI